ncbi:hypothetical protein TNCV_3778181 [Trichonephila clavipes]|nr:hypothetical protein TNCV_3778181 [Trichonephila clavipes]
MAKSSGGKKTIISLKMKMEHLKAVDEKQKTKTKICKDFGIFSNSRLPSKGPDVPSQLSADQGAAAVL